MNEDSDCDRQQDQPDHPPRGFRRVVAKDRLIWLVLMGLVAGAMGLGVLAHHSGMEARDAFDNIDDTMKRAVESMKS